MAGGFIIGVKLSSHLQFHCNFLACKISAFSNFVNVSSIINRN